jgi:hypothetical protein
LKLNCDNNCYPGNDSDATELVEKNKINKHGYNHGTKINNVNTYKDKIFIAILFHGYTYTKTLVFKHQNFYRRKIRFNCLLCIICNRITPTIRGLLSNTFSVALIFQQHVTKKYLFKIHDYLTIKLQHFITFKKNLRSYSYFCFILCHAY